MLSSCEATKGGGPGPASAPAPSVAAPAAIVIIVKLLRLEEPDEKDAKVGYWDSIDCKLAPSCPNPEGTSDMVLAGMLQLPIHMKELLSKRLLPALGASFDPTTITVKRLDDLKINLPEGAFWQPLWQLARKQRFSASRSYARLASFL